MSSKYMLVFQTKKSIDPELIVDKDILDEITCFICLGIVINPICCKNCNSLFCTDCIRDWLKKNNNCPFRCIYEESAISKLAQNLLNKTKLYCPFKECNKLLNYETYQKHFEECEMLEYSCNGCKNTFRKKFIQSHVDICDKFEVKCEICNISIAKCLYEDHVEKCPEKSILCTKCFEIYKLKDQNNHHIDCNNYKSNICETSYNQKLLFENHDKNTCIEIVKNKYELKINKLTDEIKLLNKTIDNQKKEIDNMIMINQQNEFLIQLLSSKK